MTNYSLENVFAFLSILMFVVVLGGFTYHDIKIKELETEDERQWDRINGDYDSINDYLKRHEPYENYSSSFYIIWIDANWAKPIPCQEATKYDEKLSTQKLFDTNDFCYKYDVFPFEVKD